MYDNTSWHDDPTHLLRYLRWANTRGLLTEPLHTEADDEVLDTFDRKFTEEFLTAEGARFTTAYYADGYLQEFESSDTERDAFRRLDARFAEWQRGDWSGRTKEPPPRRGYMGLGIASGAAILTVAVGLMTDPAVAVLAWLTVGMVAFVRTEVRRRR